MKVGVSDELPDPSPGEPLSVEERDAAVTEIVRRERCDSSRATGARDRGPEALLREAAEDDALRDAIVSRAERDDSREDLREELTESEARRFKGIIVG